jgi:hypothetical protein
MKLIPSMPSLIGVIPATTVILMWNVLPESSYHANIITFLYHARLKIDRASGMERPINIRISIKVIRRDPVTGKLAPASRVPPMDFNLQVIPHIDTVVIRMFKLPEPIFLGSLNEVSRMQDEA